MLLEARADTPRTLGRLHDLGGQIAPLPAAEVDLERQRTPVRG